MLNEMHAGVPNTVHLYIFQPKDNALTLRRHRPPRTANRRMLYSTAFTELRLSSSDERQGHFSCSATFRKCGYGFQVHAARRLASYFGNLECRGMEQFFGFDSAVGQALL